MNIFNLSFGTAPCRRAYETVARRGKRYTNGTTGARDMRGDSKGGRGLI